MFRVDDPTAVAALPTPEAAGTPGYFTEGVPGSTSATLVRASFLNMLQEEMISILTAAGVTASKTTYNQVLTAIEALIQKSAGNYAIDTGTANAYAATYSPAVTSLTDGMVLKFKAAHANTGASTFSPNGLTAQPIYGGDHAALTGGEIVVNGDVWLEWNSSLNGGVGAFVLIDSTGGYIKGPTPTTGDRSSKVATTQMFANEFGSSLSGSGYQKLPSGLIIQWGSCTASTSGTANTFPITFPTACYSLCAMWTGAVATIGEYVAANNVSQTGFTLYTNTGAPSSNFIAIGR